MAIQAQNPRKSVHPRKTSLSRVLWTFLGLVGAGILALGVAWSVMSRDVDSFLTYFALRVPKTITKVLDRNGDVIGAFAEENRVVIPFGDIPRAFVGAVIATEDSDFMNHGGISARGILRAGFNFVTSFGQRREGASTLTMQLVRTVTAKRQRRLDRKLKEIILARKLEQAYTKKQIFEQYANEVYFGGGRYGIEAAAEYYFGKTAPQLAVEECALLAGLVQNPNWYNPYNPDPKARVAAKLRRNHVLRRMVAEGYLKDSDAQSLLDRPIRLARENAQEEAVAPYAVEEVRKYLYEKYGRDRVLEGGLEEPVLRGGGFGARHHPGLEARGGRGAHREDGAGRARQRLFLGRQEHPFDPAARGRAAVPGEGRRRGRRPHPAGTGPGAGSGRGPDGGGAPDRGDPGHGRRL